MIDNRGHMSRLDREESDRDKRMGERIEETKEGLSKVEELVLRLKEEIG